MTDNTLELQQEEKQFSLAKDAFDRLIANKLAVIGMLLVVFLFFIAIFGPYITPYDFLSQDLQARNQAPSWAHWFGTDDLGRDIMSRVIYGARTAVIVAFSTTFLSLIIGIFMGSLGGYFGGKVDAFIVWLIDITMSVPSLLLVIVINVSMKPRLVNWMDEQFLLTGNSFYRNTILVDFVLVFGSLALIKWPKAARIIRGQIMSVRNKNYVLAAEAIGVPTPKIVWKYVIPNSIGPIIVYISAALGEAMVFESSFSFLGVGVRPPIPSWGNMISDGLRVWQLYPHILAAPAAVLALVTIAFSFLGDGLNDALNPRQWK
ncbi:peptide/nickel transport system permease protein [Cohaesibacter marisflavi]|uniref:Peptide/nickel transport system permease protein n=1 Tax=Cohaesibacter marisflavi TaxID=655353 RepID=A0A1I5CJJ0_9HYPH|nr:ABC transporter permease [Cohaesibacter marisflavi]SFN86821.1 peptide/nickel transport system permease protein [Cohaesibacter marisflavi]